MAFRIQRNKELLEKEIEHGSELVEAAAQGDCDRVEEILSRGVSVNAEAFNRSLFYMSQNYMTPLQIAAKHGHVDTVRVLIERGAYLDACDKFDVTAVHRAAESGHLACLQLLLDAGAKCNIATKYSKHGSYTAIPYVGGTTALHLATQANHLDCIRELILNGADYNACDEKGRTSLYIAAENGFQEAVLCHLSNAVGRDILSLPVKDTGDTPLHCCVRKDKLRAVQELLKHGSDVNYRNQTGFSPLHLAVQASDQFSFSIVKELVRNGYNTNVNLPDATGAAPLQYVSFGDNPKQERRPHVGAFLIAYGSTFEHLKNKHGMGLLQQELRSTVNDYTLLKAMVRAMLHVPPLHSLGIWCTPQLKRINPVPANKYKWYQKYQHKPRSLQHHCRHTVRKALGIQRLRFVNQLPLPRGLMEYLLLEFDDLQ